MSTDWQPVYSKTFLDAYLTLPLKDRRKVNQLVEQITAQPDHIGDYQDVDPVGRPLQTELIERFILTWWADHRAKELRFVAMEKV